jgi:hypothetical protein
MSSVGRNNNLTPLGAHRLRRVRLGRGWLLLCNPCDRRVRCLWPWRCVSVRAVSRLPEKSPGAFPDPDVYGISLRSLRPRAYWAGGNRPAAQRQPLIGIPSLGLLADHTQPEACGRPYAAHFALTIRVSRPSNPTRPSHNSLGLRTRRQGCMRRSGTAERGNRRLRHRETGAHHLTNWLERTASQFAWEELKITGKDGRVQTGAFLVLIDSPPARWAKV